MPFYKKSYVGVFNIASFWELQKFFVPYLLIPIAVCLGVLALRWRQVAAVFSSPMDRRTSAFGTAYAVALAFSLIILAKYMDSRLSMNVSHRFFAPLFPLALLGIAWLLNFALTSTREAQTQRPVWRGLLALLLIGGAAAQVLIYAQQFNNELQAVGRYGRFLTDEHVTVGQWLRDNAPADEWLIVVSDAGAIPYYSQLRTVDFAGLNDEVVSSLNIDEQVDYFFSYNAGAVVMTSYDWARMRFRLPRNERIVADPRFSRYRLIKRYRSDARDGYFQFLYLRDDLACKNPTACQ